MQRRPTPVVPTERLVASKRAYEGALGDDQDTTMGASYVDAVLFGKRCTRSTIAEPIPPARTVAPNANEKERT